METRVGPREIAKGIDCGVTTNYLFDGRFVRSFLIRRDDMGIIQIHLANPKASKDMFVFREITLP